MTKTITYILCLSLFFGAFAQSKNSFNVLSHGAIADGKTLNTGAIQKAIDLAATKGGKVIVPRGEFLTGTIELKSGVELQLQAGAVLLGSLDPDHYPIIHKRFGLVVAYGQSHVAITGKGVIDGQGLKLALAIDSLHCTGLRIDSNYNYNRMRPSTRPLIVDFERCEKILIKGITLKDSPGWVQNYTHCKDILIDSILVNSVAYWNNDGIDISGCENVRITNCIVNSADDGICLKSEEKTQINDNIYIGNCIVRSSASAVKFGTGSHGAFRNITIENIKVYDTYRSAIAIESVDGAVIENIIVGNVEAINTGNAFFIRLGHRNKSALPGTIRNVTIKNMKVQVPFERADGEYDLRGPDLPFFHNPFPASITGIPNFLIENVYLENIEITYPGRATKGMGYIPEWRLDQVPERESNYPEYSMFGELPAWALYGRHINGLSIKGVTLKLNDHDFRPSFVFDDTHSLQLKEIKIEAQPGEQRIMLHNCNTPVADDEMTKRITILNTSHTKK